MRETSAACASKSLEGCLRFLEERWQSCILSCTTRLHGTDKCIMKRLGISGAKVSQLGKKILTRRAGKEGLQGIRQPRSYYLILWKAMLNGCGQEGEERPWMSFTIASCSNMLGICVRGPVKSVAVRWKISIIERAVPTTMEVQRALG